MSLKNLILGILLCIIINIQLIGCYESTSTSTTLNSHEKIEILENQLHSSPNEPIQLDTELYNKIITKPRNFSIIVVLTALSPEHGCQPCREFDSELRLITSSWAKQRENGRFYVAVLDFKNGRDVFIKLGLNNVPYVLLLPPSEGQHAKEGPDQHLYDVMKNGISAESLSNFIKTHIQINIKVRRPPNYTNYAIGAIGFLFLALILQWQWEYFISMYQDYRLWRALCLGIILFMCSGFMWNQIRGAPFSGLQAGRVELFAPGFGSQYVLETQVLAMLYGACALTAVGLVVFIPSVKETATQRLLGYLCIGGFIILYSILLRVFHIKNPGYPFRMLL